jgi:hypothetical protein
MIVSCGTWISRAIILYVNMAVAAGFLKAFANIDSMYMLILQGCSFSCDRHIVHQVRDAIIRAAVFLESSPSDNEVPDRAHTFFTRLCTCDVAMTPALPTIKLYVPFNLFRDC